MTLNTTAKPPVKTPAKRAPVPVKKPAKTQFKFTCGAVEMALDDLGDLHDHEAQTRITTACQDPTASPRFCVRDLLAWSDEQRNILFTLLQQTTGSYRIRLKRDTKPHDNAFEAVLEIMEGVANPERCGCGQRAAEEAAALCRLDPKTASTRIAARLKELGVKNVLPQSLSKRIKELSQPAGGDRSNCGDDPQELAQAFLDQWRESVSLPGDRTPTRYFQTDLFAWNGRTWQRCNDAEIEALITQFLQNRTERLKITTALIANIRKNLNGLCLVSTWEQLRLPLWFDVDDDNPQASPYLAFANRLVDLSSLLHDTGPGEQTTLDSRHFSLVVLPFDYDPTAACPK